MITSKQAKEIWIQGCNAIYNEINSGTLSTEEAMEKMSELSDLKKLLIEELTRESKERGEYKL